MIYLFSWSRIGKENQPHDWRGSSEVLGDGTRLALVVNWENYTIYIKQLTFSGTDTSWQMSSYSNIIFAQEIYTEQNDLESGRLENFKFSDNDDSI